MYHMALYLNFSRYLTLKPTISVVKNIGIFLFCLYHIVFATSVYKITIFFKEPIKDQYDNVQEFKELYSLST